MMKLTTQSKEFMTIQEIKEKLLQKYEKTHGGHSNREITITKPTQGYGECYFITLDGSPPKGYGIWIPENRNLYLFSATGEKFREYSLQQGIPDLENKKE